MFLICFILSVCFFRDTWNLRGRKPFVSVKALRVITLLHIEAQLAVTGIQLDTFITDSRAKQMETEGFEPRSRPPSSRTVSNYMSLLTVDNRSLVTNSVLTLDLLLRDL